jgi:CheY-like chemotaxis protein
VCVRIKDNGIGIAPENLQRVFEMFTQVGRSLEQSRGGLGVGLSLSQWLVRLHGGAIEAHSDGLNRGSEFVVRLPLAAPAPAAKPLAGSASARPHAIPKRVLVCDDNRDFADSLASMLRLAGNEVCVTYDGLEAVAAAGIWRPDVVLLDIGMPHLNGYETARRIGDGLAGRKPLLVAITGWGQEEDRRRSRAAGFTHHFVKPVDPATIIRVVAGAASTDAMDDERTPA